MSQYDSHHYYGMLLSMNRNRKKDIMAQIHNIFSNQPIHWKSFTTRMQNFRINQKFYTYTYVERYTRPS